MICPPTQLELVPMRCHWQALPSGWIRLQRIILNHIRFGVPRKILPLCLGHFETYLDGCREDNPRNRSSLRISKLHINHLRTAPFRLACNRIQITFTRDHENTSRQRDGKGRHIDCHSINIYCNSLTWPKFLRSLARINGPILRLALRPY